MSPPEHTLAADSTMVPASARARGFGIHPAWYVGIAAAVALGLFHEQLWALIQLAIVAGTEVIGGLRPTHLAEAYFGAQTFPRLIIGLCAISTTLLLVIGVPHVLINCVALYRELSTTSGGWSITAFVARQNREQTEYLEQLSVVEAASLQLGRDFSAQDDLEAQKVIDQISVKDRRWYTSLLARFSNPATEPIRTFSGAAAHFVFSFASLTRSACTYTRIWNVWFAFRTFFPLLHPILFFTLITRPEYFRVATSRLGRPTRPSRFNGGLRSLFAFIRLRFFRAEEWRHLRETEAKIIQWIEDPLHEAIHASNITSLRRRELILDRAQASWMRNQQELVALSPGQATQLVETAAAEIGELGDSWVTKLAEARAWLRKSIADRIDPTRSRPVQIIQITESQLKNPKAMARAVRSMIASNLVDKPLQLLILFSCYAGIQEGLLRPLQPELFGPNSWFHLSRYVFINGFIYAVIAGIFSDTWLKIQQDTMCEGHFDLAPEGADTRKSFVSWFFRKSFANKNNSWWRSQVFTVKQYILPTTKATFVTALIVNYVSMGRFDLDSFLANFLVLVFLPFTGLTWQIEQGFEIAAAWVVRDVPKRLRPHPLVQSYALREIAQRRIVFNVFYKIWENITFDFLNLFSNMNSIAFGTRSFSRILFMGFTPTELVVNPLRNLAVNHAWPAPVLWLMSQVDGFLTHNYTDGTRLER